MGRWCCDVDPFQIFSKLTSQCPEEGLVCRLLESFKMAFLNKRGTPYMVFQPGQRIHDISIHPHYSQLEITGGTVGMRKAPPK
jgi:hypothetical protein